jgi:alkylation response protein AidB-like acyl-CoA dehydrogenase
VDFELSKPQKLLQTSVREFLHRECSTEHVRHIMDSDRGFDQGLWAGLADQGWLGLTLPEDHEALELGAVELAAVAEIQGQFCLPAPTLSNLWAAGIVAAAGNEGQAARLLPGIVEGEQRATVALLEASADWDPQAVAATAERTGSGFRIDGQKLFVTAAASAETVLWLARLEGEIAIFAIDRTSLKLEDQPALDPARRLYTVGAERIEVAADRLLARGESAEAALATATREATVAACAELVGGMQWVMGTTLEYVQNRKQFGKIIGTYQAVQHRMADILLHLESARSATYYAAWAVAEGDLEADRLVSIAKAYCSDAGREVSNSGIQIHGGIGFTWEHDLQLYFKRAKALEILFGDATYHRERIARLVIDRRTEAA